MCTTNAQSTRKSSAIPSYPALVYKQQVRFITLSICCTNLNEKRSLWISDCYQALKVDLFPPKKAFSAIAMSPQQASLPADCFRQRFLTAAFMQAPLSLFYKEGALQMHIAAVTRHYTNIQCLQLLPYSFELHRRTSNLIISYQALIL